MLLKVLAAPVNPSDLNMIEGTYPVQPRWRWHKEEGHEFEYAVPGLEGVAQVVQVGVDFKGHFNVGDWVVPLNQGFSKFIYNLECH